MSIEHSVSYIIVISFIGVDQNSRRPSICSIGHLKEGEEKKKTKKNKKLNFVPGTKPARQLP